MVARGEAFSSLACYDALTAHWLEKAGIDVLIVGDSAAQIVLGQPNTTFMPLEVAIALTAGVKRGAPSCMVMADMPFMSYHVTESEALRNAGRFMTEGLADVVKIEADASWSPLAAKMTRAGIPICAHIGLMPQRMKLEGGYGIAGKTPTDAERVVRDAVELEEAGAVMLLVEAVPPEVAERVMEATTVPLIGIGAGPACHGQVLVLADILGLTENPPSFAPRLREFGPELQGVAEEFVRRVKERIVTDHRYEMKLSGGNAVQPN